MKKPGVADCPAAPSSLHDGPIAYYDGACPLCAREIAFYRRQAGASRIHWIDVSRLGGNEVAPDLSNSAALARFHVRDIDGSLVSGARRLSLCGRTCRASAGCARSSHHDPSLGFSIGVTPRSWKSGLACNHWSGRAARAKGYVSIGRPASSPYPMPTPRSPIASTPRRGRLNICSCTPASGAGGMHGDFWRWSRQRPASHCGSIRRSARLAATWSNPMIVAGTRPTNARSCRENRAVYRRRRGKNRACGWSPW